MIKTAAIALGFVLLGSTAAFAACPTSVPGNSSEAITANQQRLACLQREIDNSSTQRRMENQIDTINSTIRTQTLQRRFDDLPTFRPVNPSFRN